MRSIQAYDWRNPFVRSHRFVRLIRRLALAIFFCCSLCVRAQELGERQTAPGGGFSIRLPNGWKVTTIEQDGALQAQGPNGNMKLKAQEVSWSGSLSDFVNQLDQDMRNRNPSFKILDTNPFQTESGMKGTEVFSEMRAPGNPLMREMIFFFDGRPGYMVYVVCVVLGRRDNKAVHSLYEDVVTSLRLGE